MELIEKYTSQYLMHSSKKTDGLYLYVEKNYSIVNYLLRKFRLKNCNFAPNLTNGSKLTVTKNKRCQKILQLSPF